MKELVFDTVFFVFDVIYAISIYHQGHFAWACILSACAGMMFVFVGFSAKELIENGKE